ncbi:hypothetical protein CBM2589_U10187 [Cupriavidus taiwanensis]|uniref:Uncharacterized protein n=1 Tax=Cupriavidus taiwanensis TaxID=164546 RepID=A0A375CQI4_9BURK|nr:hypothetical protein CBM2589_U10187 [Cupriavidus taiwanensis]
MRNAPQERSFALKSYSRINDEREKVTVA